MPIQMYWHDDEQCILHVHYAGRWQPAMLTAAVDEAFVYLSSTPHPVVTLNTFEDLRWLPVNSWPPVFRFLMNAPANYRGSVMVDPIGMIASTFDLFLPLTGHRRHRLTFVHTLDEALDCARRWLEQG